MIPVADRFADYRFVRSTAAGGQQVVTALDQALRTNFWFGIAAFAVFLLQYLLIFTHRPWLDEWQALQIALETLSFPDLLASLKYEGHPPLWYLILRGLGTFTSPYQVLPLAAAACATVAQGLILFRCPFTRAERILLALGCFMLFEFMTLSRSMTLGVTLLVFASAFWRTRLVWLAIILLPLCDLLFGILSVIMLTQLLLARRVWPAGIAMWLAVSLFSAWTVLPADDMIPALPKLGLLADLSNFMLRSGLLLVPLQWAGWQPGWDGVPPLGTGALLAFGFYLFAWRNLKGDPVQAVLFFGFVTFTLLFSLVIYPLAARHLMLIALLLIMFAWQRALGGQSLTSGFRTWLIVGAACGLFVASWSFAQPFDTAYLAGREIQKRGLTGKHWVAFPDSRGQSVSALTGMKFESAEGRCMQTFVRWNSPQALDTLPELSRHLDARVRAQGRFYLLTDVPLHGLPASLVEPIAHIESGYDQADFYLWSVGGNAPEATPTIPDCTPGLRGLGEAQRWFRTAGAAPH